MHERGKQRERGRVPAPKSHWDKRIGKWNLKLIQKSCLNKKFDYKI